MPFQIGDSLRYTNYVHNEMGDLVNIKTNNPDNNKYSIKFLRGNTVMVTKESLKSRNVTDIVYIPISPEDYVNE